MDEQNSFAFKATFQISQLCIYLNASLEICQRLIFFGLDYFSLQRYYLSAKRQVVGNLSLYMLLKGINE